MEGLKVSQGFVYKQNMGLLKRYSEERYKLIYMKSLREKGYEEAGDSEKGKKGSAGNPFKLRESISRTKSRVYELALCNPWEYFITLTLSAKTHDRNDLISFKHELSKWINNYNYQKHVEVKYLLIPEPHKDGAWHMHGLIMGLPLEHLVEFKVTDNIPQKIKRMIKIGRTIYNWLPYARKFGWVTAEKVMNHQKCSAYITKYITKELMETRIALNDHVYYCSTGLNRAEVILKAEIRQMFEPDFKNDYIMVKSFDNIEEPLQYFCDEEESPWN